MFGVLFDVSASMEESFAANYNKLDALTDDNVKRSLGIVTTLNNIVNQEITTYERKDLVFVSAFGLNPSRCNDAETCDFVSMLEERKTLQKIDEIKDRWEKYELYPIDGRRILIHFAECKNAKHAVPWIKEKLEQKEAGILWEVLKDDDELTKMLTDLIPPESTHRMTEVASKFGECISYTGECVSYAGERVSYAEECVLYAGECAVSYAGKCVSWAAERLHMPKRVIVGAGCVASLAFGGPGLVLVPASIAYMINHGSSKTLTHCALLPVHLVGSKLQQQGKVLKKSIDSKVEDNDALKLARNIVKDKLSKEIKFEIKFQKLKSHLAKDVSNLLDTILQGNKEASSSRVNEFINSIKPYIYGGSPMVKALKEAKEIFDNKTEINPKVLFILSDGCATDGDPVFVLHELEKSNVIVVTGCFTSRPVSNAKCLFDKEDPSWDEGARILYRVSSTMANTRAPITHLVDYGWKLPSSGECRLFVRANSLDVVEEFCKVAVSQLAHGTDALVHMLGRISLATYINQKNDTFKAQDQEDATCYAYAIAAVFHLAMHRIFGREGKIPDFIPIKDRIIQEYGKKGNTTETVIKNLCPEYRLRYRKVDEEGARQAINGRRPVVARQASKNRCLKNFF